MGILATFDLPYLQAYCNAEKNYFGTGQLTTENGKSTGQLQIPINVPTAMLRGLEGSFFFMPLFGRFYVTFLRIWASCGLRDHWGQ